MRYCTGTTPSKVQGFNYEHACKLEAGHEGECICVGCEKSFVPNPPLPVRLVKVTEGQGPATRVVPAEEIDPVRSLLARDYMKWSRGGG
jgi:hypothetical protein